MYVYFLQMSICSFGYSLRISFVTIIYKQRYSRSLNKLKHINEHHWYQIAIEKYIVENKGNTFYGHTKFVIKYAVGRLAASPITLVCISFARFDKSYLKCSIFDLKYPWVVCLCIIWLFLVFTVSTEIVIKLSIRMFVQYMKLS